MSDIMKIALAKRERLMAELEKLNDFIRMAERLVREEGEQPRPVNRPQPEPVQAAPDPHRSLSAVLRDVEDQEAEAGQEPSRRTGLWRTASVAGAKG